MLSTSSGLTSSRSLVGGILEIEMRVGSMLLLRKACNMSLGVREPVIQAESGHPRREWAWEMFPGDQNNSEEPV